jgi:hypothetical protein
MDYETRSDDGPATAQECQHKWSLASGQLTISQGCHDTEMSLSCN